MARSFGSTQEEAEDIVQDMYIKIYKYVRDPDSVMYSDTEVNTCYIYVTLRNIYIQTHNRESKFETIDDEYDVPDPTEYDELHDYRMQELNSDVQNEINSWNWYDRKIFTICFSGGYNMHKLAKESGISRSSILITVKKCKNILRDKFGIRYSRLKLKEEM
jgi:RNA polymerase sigma factor (sigma-70 family)